MSFVQPKFGVYVSRVFAQGQRYAGVTNVGVKPTVGSDQTLSETWMPDYRGGELYGRSVRVELLQFLRPEHRFPTLEALRAQILRDGVQAREFFSQNASAAERI